MSVFAVTCEKCQKGYKVDMTDPPETQVCPYCEAAVTQRIREAAGQIGLVSPTDANGQVPPTAANLLKAGLQHMDDRAATYDAPAGERSMGKTVAAFNALTGHELTEAEGWLFMGVLKMARTTQGNFRRDNFEDMAAYAGLYGEAAAKEKEQ